MIARGIAILILLIQPWLAAITHARVSAAPQSGEAVTCPCTECTCCCEGAPCPCAVQAPAAPLEPTPAPAPPTQTTPLRFTLPPAHFLFELPQPAAPPVLSSALVHAHPESDSHNRILARLCVWRT